MRDAASIDDPGVLSIPIEDANAPLVDVRRVQPKLRIDDRKQDPLGAWALVRTAVAWRLREAQHQLPEGLELLIIEGFRPAELQGLYFEQHLGMLRSLHPDWPTARLRADAALHVAPPHAAPHITGAAVDLTLCTLDGEELDLGSPVNATPHESAGTCFTFATGLSDSAAALRGVLVSVLTSVGMVNYPFEWWHWSYGDRYWARAKGVAPAPSGPFRGDLPWSGPQVAQASEEKR